jgi:hypothetical protein
MSSHTLKCKPGPFAALVSGEKTSEVRRCDDRVFKVGQTVEIKEVDADGIPTGNKLYRRITHIQTDYGLPDNLCVLSYGNTTPAAAWRVEGEEDPHGTRYDTERADLVLGHLTDDQLANAAFMGYDLPLNIDRVLAKDPNYYTPIALMTAVKDRLRWLSRKLEEARESASA